MATIGSITGSTGTPATGQKADNAVGDASMGKDTFLKLLVAQLKYQDPSNPADSTQFMSQTAQFTMVEKLDALAASQTSLAAANTLQSATSVVGRKITWQGADGADKTGVVSSVTITNGVANLQVGTESVALTAVNKVENP
jgi:flagellar basal-body rod modification protein FlgD